MDKSPTGSDMGTLMLSSPIPVTSTALVTPVAMTPVLFVVIIGLCHRDVATLLQKIVIAIKAIVIDIKCDIHYKAK